MVADRIKEERTEGNQQQHRDNKCDSKRHLLFLFAFCYGAHPLMSPRIKAMLLGVSCCIMWTCLIEVMDKIEEKRTPMNILRKTFLMILHSIKNRKMKSQWLWGWQQTTWQWGQEGTSAQWIKRARCLGEYPALLRTRASKAYRVRGHLTSHTHCYQNKISLVLQREASKVF